MSRCVICDFETGIYNPTAPYMERKGRPFVRWREKFNEYQCDDCFSSIENNRKNMEFTGKETINELQQKLFQKDKSNPKKTPVS